MPNDFFALVREIGGDYVENVIKIDEYYNKKIEKQSQTYKILYRSLERTLLNEEIDILQFRLREEIESKMNVELR